MSLPEAIATNFWSRNRWADRSDLIQQAHLADAECRRTFAPERGTPLRAYRSAAIRRALWGYVLHMRAPVAGSRDAIKAVQTVELPHDDTLPGDNSEWRVRVRRVVAEELVGEPLASDVLLLGYKPSEVAERHGIHVEQVYKAVVRGKYRLRKCRALMDLWAHSTLATA